MFVQFNILDQFDLADLSSF